VVWGANFFNGQSTVTESLLFKYELNVVKLAQMAWGGANGLGNTAILNVNKGQA
jgi:hypothetical protein